MMNKKNRLIVICNGKSCRRDGANHLIKYIKENANNTVEFTTKYCFGRCGNGPVTLILPEEKLIENCTLAIMQKFIKKY